MKILIKSHDISVQVPPQTPPHMINYGITLTVLVQNLFYSTSHWCDSSPDFFTNKVISQYLYCWSAIAA